MSITLTIAGNSMTNEAPIITTTQTTYQTLENNTSFTVDIKQAMRIEIL